MSTQYEPKQIEKKWQDRWEQSGVFRAESSHDKKKYYCLIEFPYPSGKGLHVGHPRSNTALDIIARKRRMEGYNVLYPIGYDAFGLPTENYAIKNKIHPAKVTADNIENFRNQLKRLGFSFDYSREVNTTDPNYYKWTQLIFLLLLKHGLAYKSKMPINWCTSCKVGLANEEVVNGVCERCGSEVVQKTKEQWMLRITKYAQKLIDGLDKVNFIEKVKTQQINWIGRSEGAELEFAVKGKDYSLRVFTTRPDTLFGATYMVVSPEHPMLERFQADIKNFESILAYQEAARHKSDFERSELNKDKTGVEIQGLKALNPANGKEIPIWVSDYVLMSYGTGAIMAVPAHDERDYAFATKFGIDIIEVIAGGDISKEAFTDTQRGTLVNSGFLNGFNVPEAKARMIDWIESEKIGERKVNFKLRDWVFSRQRYWGEPIPVVHCPHCGIVPIPEKDLPVLLPDIDNYEPNDSGESPLANISSWVSTKCPACGADAKRETDTMPQWAGSSWYFLRYCDPHNDKEFASKKELDYWMPVDWYNGGMEHTTLHLLYSRFWHLFLHDIGLVSAPEPYMKRTSQGMILGSNSEKMSKSRGNVITPDEMVDILGADAFRMYEMFMGAFDQAIPWSTSGAKGCRKFLDRVWRLQDMLNDEKGISPKLSAAIHSCVKKVGEDFEEMKFNTAIAAMMSLVNEIYAVGSLSKEDLKTLLLLLSPVCPHIAEEMYENLGYTGGITFVPWPVYDEKALVKSEFEIAVQLNGKIRARIMVPADLSQEEAQSLISAHAEVKPLLTNKTVMKFIFVSNRLANFIVK